VGEQPTDRALPMPPPAPVTSAMRPVRPGSPNIGRSLSPGRGRNFEQRPCPASGGHDERGAGTRLLMSGLGASSPTLICGRESRSWTLIGAGQGVLTRHLVSRGSGARRGTAPGLGPATLRMLRPGAGHCDLDRCAVAEVAAPPVPGCRQSALRDLQRTAMDAT
jgi:hypothetical protein